MLRLNRLVLSMIFLIFRILVFAQDRVSIKVPLKWDLNTCLQYARENNVQISSLKLDAKSSQLQLSLSSAALLPDLNGIASQNFTHTKSSNIGLSGSYGLNTSMTVYKGGSLKTEIKQQELNVKSAGLSVEEQENELVVQVTQAYLNILMDKEVLRYYQDLLRTSKAQLEQAKQRFSVGSIAHRDVVQFEVQLASDKYSLTTAENTCRQDLLALKQLLLISHEAPFEVTTPDSIQSKVLIPALSEVRKFALENRPEIKNSFTGIRLAQLELDKAKSGYLPTISLNGSVGTSYANSSQYSYSDKQFSDNFNQQVGLTLSIPIFSRKLNKTNSDLAKIGISKAQLNLVDTKMLLSQEIEKTYINALNAQSQFNAAEKQFEYNEEIYRIASEELKLGSANVFDFYQQRNLYIKSLQSYVQAKYNAALSASLYNFYLGIPISF